MMNEELEKYIMEELNRRKALMKKSGMSFVEKIIIIDEAFEYRGFIEIYEKPKGSARWTAPFTLPTEPWDEQTKTPTD